VAREVQDDEMTKESEEDLEARAADLHVWVAERTMMYARMCMVAGSPRSAIWDAVADNTGVMMAISQGKGWDLTRSLVKEEESKFTGGKVLDPAAW